MFSSGFFLYAICAWVLLCTTIVMLAASRLWKIAFVAMPVGVIVLMVVRCLVIEPAPAPAADTDALLQHPLANPFVFAALVASSLLLLVPLAIRRVLVSDGKFDPAHPDALGAFDRRYIVMRTKALLEKAELGETRLGLLLKKFEWVAAYIFAAGAGAGLVGAFVPVSDLVLGIAGMIALGANMVALMMASNAQAGWKEFWA